MEIIIYILGFIPGLIIGFIVFNERYLKYKKYWEKLRLVVKYQVSIDMLMDSVERNVYSKE